MTLSISHTITGHEPRLSSSKSQMWQVSPRRLATMLSELPADQVPIPVAAAALHHASWSVRYSAAIALSRRADREARLVMQEALMHGEAPTRASVARHLNGFSWFAAEPLIRLALQDADSRVREAAIYGLADFIEPKAYPLMAEALQNEVDHVRLAAAIGLRDRQDPAAVAALAMALRAEDAEVRIAAIQALGANHTPPATAPVIEAVRSDASAEVVYEATQSLIELEAEKALPVLIEVIQDAAYPHRAEVIRGLSHAANYTVLDLAATPYTEALLDALEMALGEPLTRQDALWPLAWMRHARAGDLLLEAYMRSSESAFKAMLVRVVVSLMSMAREAILPLAQADAEHDAEMAATLNALKTGGEYDAAARGIGFANPILGR